MIFLVDKNGEPVQMPINIGPSEDYRAIYANGASGGFLANYHFRLDFYQDVVPPVRYVDKTGQGSIDFESVKEGVERKILVSVFLSVPFLKELVLWLENHLKTFEEQYGEVQLPKSNVPGSATGEVQAQIAPELGPALGWRQGHAIATQPGEGTTNEERRESSDDPQRSPKRSPRRKPDA